MYNKIVIMIKYIKRMISMNKLQKIAIIFAITGVGLFSSASAYAEFEETKTETDLVREIGNDPNLAEETESEKNTTLIEVPNNELKRIDEPVVKSSVILDEGLKTIINQNLNRDLATDITVTDFSRLTIVNFDRVTAEAPLTINDYSGLENATKMYAFGSTFAADKATGLTLNHLDQFVLIANKLSNLTQLRFSWLDIPDVSPLAALDKVQYIWLKASYGMDYSSLAKLYERATFKQLVLVYERTWPLQIPTQEYQKGIGIEAATPFILPDGQSFDIENAVLPAGWSYQNGYFVNPSLSSGDTKPRNLDVTFRVKGNNTDKLRFGNTNAPDQFMKFSYSYTMPKLEAIEAKDSTLYTGDTWQAEDNFISAADIDGNPIPFAQVKVTGTVDTTKVGTYPIKYSYGQQIKEIIVTVKTNQAAIDATDSTLYVGDNWQAEDNFISATGKDGSPAIFSQVEVNGTVDASKAGTYVISYQYDGQVKEIIVTVKANQTAIAAKDSTIYVGDTWEAKDNFISATDKIGAPIDFSQVEVIGTVDTSTVGSYPISYRYGGQTNDITVIVKENQSAVDALDSTIYVGETWKTEDNFVSATDKAGNTVAFSQVEVTGTVDTGNVGAYIISYRYGGQTKDITVTVKENQSVIDAFDSTIYVGDAWQAEDNFISAIDKAGNPVAFSQVRTIGTVNTNKAGTYLISYGYGGQMKAITVTVKANQTAIDAKNSTIYVGDTWEAIDNFISAIDRDGNAVPFEELEIAGMVETSKVGTYQITYSYQGDSKTIVVEVKEKVIELPPGNQPSNPQDNNNKQPEKENNHKNQNQENRTATQENQSSVTNQENENSRNDQGKPDQLPATGETQVDLVLMGVLLLVASIIYFSKKKWMNQSE